MCDAMQHVADGYALDIDVHLSAEERFITMLHHQGDEEENVLFLHRTSQVNNLNQNISRAGKLLNRL